VTPGATQLSCLLLYLTSHFPTSSLIPLLSTTFQGYRGASPSAISPFIHAAGGAEENTFAAHLPHHTDTSRRVSQPVQPEPANRTPAMATNVPVTGDTPIAVKILFRGQNRKYKIPLKDTSATVLPLRVRRSRCLAALATSGFVGPPQSDKLARGAPPHVNMSPC
jgi:hypothetical protein